MRHSLAFVVLPGAVWSVRLTDLSPLEQTEETKTLPRRPVDELPDGVEVRGEASTATVRGAAVPYGELEVIGTPGEIRCAKYVFSPSNPPVV
jgi:hypothetical protein